jgi:hypothetical protein
MHCDSSAVHRTETEQVIVVVTLQIYPTGITSQLEGICEI